MGAPGLVPPCILHRRFPFTAGDWHSVPVRVRAKQRGALASRSGCIGLIDRVSKFLAPGMMVEMIGNNGLSAFCDMHMLDGLLTRLVQLCQSLKR